MVPSEDENQISLLRSSIDLKDREIIKLVMERAMLVREIGERKRSGSTPIYRPDREKAVYENVIQEAHKLFGESLPFPEKVIRSIYREIMSGSIAVEGGPGVAYLGPAASFSHMAVRHRFGASVRAVPRESIDDVFRAAESAREVKYGVVPVENSTEGSVGQTLDQLMTSDLKIYAEHYEKISQNLLTPAPTELSRIRKVYTKPIAREQCRNWIQQNLRISDVEFIDTPSTTAAARLVAESGGDVAAISSELAADTYKLHIQCRDIQDQANNVTRFLVIGNETCGPTGDDKSSIICTVHDRPGSLFDLLKPFYENGVNMTHIESRSSRRYYGDYNFYIDFLGHSKDEAISAILDQLRERTTFLKLLGSYPRMDPP